MDRDYRDPLDVINQVGDNYLAQLEADPYNPRMAWMAGIDFYNKITQIAKIPSVRILSEWPIPYRDDNRYFWAFSENMFVSQGIDYMPSNQGPVRRNVNIMEFVNEIDSEMTHDNPDEILVLSSELFPYEDDLENTKSWNETEGVEPISDPFHYNEWDYHVQLARPEWATVMERRQPKGDPEVMDEILTKHKPIASRIRYLIDAMQPQGIVRRRGYEEGEELDLNAAVRAMIDVRRGIMPDPRINIRITRHLRDLSIVLLLDLSESTNEKPGFKEGDPGYEEADSILDLTRESAGLLSWAIDSIGDNFAVHGFASDGRHDVQYYRFKDFEQPYDDDAKSRLAGMKGGLSTRMGAALRHAGHHLTQQSAQKRLVLLVTDGEPADIDERDPQYLRHDTKKAVDDLAMQGVYTYCLTLDPNADRYVARIFGENNYSIVDHVERLPERLPNVFAALTG
jgi:nitric oxide reductase activation protein